MEFWRRRYKNRKRLWHKLLKNDLVPVDYSIPRYGSEYGGWHVPSELIKPDWLVYDIGVGEDISFARALIERHGCVVHAFDPTPQAIAFVAKQNLPGFHFHPVGVWHEDATIKFYTPRFEGFVSHSALNLKRTSTYFTGPVKTVKTLAAELGHERIDLIKMDIEGAEQRVIPSILSDGFRPALLCVEYDQPYEVLSPLAFRCFAAALRLHRQLRKSGYLLIHKGDWEATYLHRSGA